MYADLGGAKVFKRAKWEQTSSWLNRLFSSPEYYFTKDSTANRILDIALEKDDNKFEWKRKVEGDFLSIVQDIKKTNPRAYKLGNSYLLNADKTGRGFSISESDKGLWEVLDPSNKPLKSFAAEYLAVDFMIEAEQKFLKKKRVTPQARQVIFEARKLTNRGFDLTVEDMKRQIKTAKDNDIPEPTMAYFNTTGVKSDLALSEAIAFMGDLRGTYFPRERQNKEFSLQARGKGLANQLHTFDLFLPFNVQDPKSISAIKKHFNSRTPVGAKIRALEKDGYSDIALTPVRSPAGMIFDVSGLLASMDSLLTVADEKTSSEEMREADRKILTAASEQLSLRIADIYKAKGQFSSRMHRSEALWEGYEEDALKALASYSQRVSTGAAMRETARSMLFAFTGRDVSWAQYTRERPSSTYAEYRKMTKKKAVNAVSQRQLYEDLRLYMSYVLKPDTRLNRALGYVKALAVVKFLGFRVSSAAINMTNMAMAVPATMAAHTGSSLTSSWTHLTKAAGKYGLYRLELLSQTSDVSQSNQRRMRELNKKEKLSAEDRQVFAEISRRGWDEAQFNHDAARVLQDNTGKAFEAIIKVAMYAFGVTEKANRAMTVFAAYKAHKAEAIKKGEPLSEDEYFKLAQHTSNRAHGVYGKAAKPWIVQNFQLFDLPYTFQKFQHNYMLNMTEIGMKGAQDKNRAQATKNILYLLLAPGILAGTGATLVAKLAFQIIGSLTDQDDPEEDFYHWMDEHFGAGGFVSRGVRHGLSGAIAHINLRGSLQMNNPMPTTLEELAGAPGGVALDIRDSLIHFSRSEFQKGFEKGLPTALGSMVKAQREFSEGVTTKTYSPVYFGPERLKASGMDAALKFFSFNPSRLSSIREIQWKEKLVAQEFTKRRSLIKREIHQMIVQDTESDVKWAKVFNMTQEYNERAMAAHQRYQIPYINSAWLKGALKSAYRPKRYERTRDLLGR